MATLDIGKTTLDRDFFERAAWEYYDTLPLEHFMESLVQSTQRKITLDAFGLIHITRPDIWCYSELLIQWVIDEKNRKLGRVVPDNLIVRHPSQISMTSSFNLSIEDAKPFMALEYVSNTSQKRDYEEKIEIYREKLKIPYYLTHEPDELRLYRLEFDGSYSRVKANREGRLEIPDLETEVGLVDGWARFWFRRKLVPLPEELQSENKELQSRLTEEQTARQAMEERMAKMQAELEALRKQSS